MALYQMDPMLPLPDDVSGEASPPVEVDGPGADGMPEAYQRFLERDRRTQQMRDDALSRLASVLHPQSERLIVTEGPPLLMVGPRRGRRPRHRDSAAGKI